MARRSQKEGEAEKGKKEEIEGLQNRYLESDICE